MILQPTVNLRAKAVGLLRPRLPEGGPGAGTAPLVGGHVELSAAPVSAVLAGLFGVFLLFWFGKKNTGKIRFGGKNHPSCLKKNREMGKN